MSISYGIVLGLFIHICMHTYKEKYAKGNSDPAMYIARPILYVKITARQRPLVDHHVTRTKAEGGQ